MKNLLFQQKSQITFQERLYLIFVRVNLNVNLFSFCPYLGTLGDELTSFGSFGALDSQSSSAQKTNKRKRKATPKKRGGKKRKFH